MKYTKFLLGVLLPIVFAGCKSGADCPNPPIIEYGFIFLFKKAIIPYTNDSKLKFRNMKTDSIEYFHVLSKDSTIESLLYHKDDEECLTNLKYELNQILFTDSFSQNYIMIKHYSTSGFDYAQINLNNKAFGPEIDYDFGRPSKALSLTINGKLYEDLSWKFYDSSNYVIFKPNFGILRIVTPEKAYEYVE
ncbi:MAG: hypothetical protein CFE21_04085 [Bacteroidetes bacterium B1(2017)]|nr:MAG: hypothetical protein CFE21_04085 [Bacteroidetes bacterium B1(2017)]